MVQNTWISPCVHTHSYWDLKTVSCSDIWCSIHYHYRHYTAFFYFSCWNTCTQYVREATADLPSKAGDSFLSFFWLSGFPLTRHALFIAGAAKLAGILIIHIAGVEWVGLGRQSYVLNTLALSILRVLCLTLTSSALTVQWCLCQYNMLGRQI